MLRGVKRASCHIGRTNARTDELSAVRQQHGASQSIRSKCLGAPRYLQRGRYQGQGQDRELQGRNLAQQPGEEV